MSYQIIVSKSVQKQLDKLPHLLLIRIGNKLEELSLNPLLKGVIKMKASENQYRLRVGDYRIRYEIDNSNLYIKILQCKHRREVYKD